MSCERIENVCTNPIRTPRRTKTPHSAAIRLAAGYPSRGMRPAPRSLFVGSGSWRKMALSQPPDRRGHGAGWVCLAPLGSSLAPMGPRCGRRLEVVSKKQTGPEALVCQPVEHRHQVVCQEASSTDQTSVLRPIVTLFRQVSRPQFAFVQTQSFLSLETA